MREAVGEANMTTVTIVLLAIVITAGITIGANSLISIKGNNSKCTKYGYSYDSKRNKCVDSMGNYFDLK